MTTAAAIKAWETRRARGWTPKSGAPSPDKAPRAPRPVLVLTAPAPDVLPPRDASHDAADWAALEEAHTEWMRAFAGDGVAGLRPAHPDRAHPKSYGAAMHLPLRPSFDRFGNPAIPPLTPEEKRYLATRETRAAVEIRPNAPHPRSYGADNPLPLRGLKFHGQRGRHRWPLTPAEKATLVGRPIRYVRAA